MTVNCRYHCLIARISFFLTEGCLPPLPKPPGHDDHNPHPEDLHSPQKIDPNNPCKSIKLQLSLENMLPANLFRRCHQQHHKKKGRMMRVVSRCRGDLYSESKKETRICIPLALCIAFRRVPTGMVICLFDGKE